MSLFNSIVRGFGYTIGSKAANRVTSPSGINSLWKLCWGFVKWCIIITFVIGLIQGFLS
jgi:hypothetical protein